MSREIVFCIPNDRPDLQMTEEQTKVNDATKEILKACVNELYFVIKAQPFPFTRVLRFADVLMENDRKIMEMLDKRHLITPEVFENDQKVFMKIIEDWQKEIAVRYIELYKFLMYVEETHAYEGFRSLFDLPDVEKDMSDEERHISNFVNRKFVWMNSSVEPSWLYNSLQFYNTLQYVQNPIKTKILARYGPE
ncbi:hypothetical protein CRE_04267 [Caenorhabditis remanei]|nr:hypothetical protein CRE_04267 [Caenorhabditis remanei]